MSNYLVYKIEFPNKKVYIGITSQGLEERKRKHYVRLNTKCKFKLYNALRKYKNQEKWYIIKDNLNKYEACKLEQKYIILYDSYFNGYNSTLGGESNYGRLVTKETRKKLSLINKGKNNPNFGKKRDYGSKLKCAISNGSKPFKVINKITNEVVGIWTIKKQCARDLNLNYQLIGHCLENRHGYKSHKRFTFKYVEETSC